MSVEDLFKNVSVCVLGALHNYLEDKIIPEMVETFRENGVEVDDNFFVQHFKDIDKLPEIRKCTSFEKSQIKYSREKKPVKTTSKKTYFDTEKHKLFYKYLHEFCIQAVSGIFMALLRTVSNKKRRISEILSDTETANELLKLYVNQSWKSYHLQEDDFVVNSINKINDVGLMKHTSCIFSWIVSACKKMIEYVESFVVGSTNIENSSFDIIRTLLNRKLEEGTNENTKLLISTGNVVTCDGKCSVYHYEDGEDYVL